MSVYHIKNLLVPTIISEPKEELHNTQLPSVLLQLSTKFCRLLALMFTHNSIRKLALTNLHQLLRNSPFNSFVGMMEDMHDYGVYADVVDIVFDEEELDDSDVEEDHHANETMHISAEI